MGFEHQDQHQQHSRVTVVVVVVLTLTHRYNAVRGVTGQAPITLERKIISGGNQIKTEDNTHNKAVCYARLFEVQKWAFFT